MKPTFTIRSEVDFIALAPVVLGFQPAHSLVMMTVNSFHARVDLPDPEDIQSVISSLLNPAKRHNVGRVAFIIFDEGEHHELKEALLHQFEAADIQVLAAVEVGAGKYREFYGEWHPLDLTDHPLTLEAAYMDRAPRHASRDELVAYVRPLGEPVSDQVKQAVVGLALAGCGEFIGSLTRGGGCRFDGSLDRSPARLSAGFRRGVGCCRGPGLLSVACR